MAVWPGYSVAVLSGGASTAQASTAYTIAMWVELPGFSTGGGFVFRYLDSSNTNGVAIGMAGGAENTPQPTMRIYHNTTLNNFSLPVRRQPAHAPGMLNPWYHLAVTWTDTISEVLIYLNGRLTTRGIHSGTPTTGGSGRAVTVLNNSIRGKFSSMMWWADVALSRSQVNCLYRGQVAIAPSGWWAVGCGAQNGIDRSGNGNHLTATFGQSRQPWADPPWVTSPTLAARLT